LNWQTHYCLYTTYSPDGPIGRIRVKHPCFRSLAKLLVEIGVVMMVPMMVMVMHDYHNLSLRRLGHCKTRKENQTDPELVHTLL
jgi:hypothetical protein